jgi:hypothetical protein
VATARMNPQWSWLLGYAMACAAGGWTVSSPSSHELGVPWLLAFVSATSVGVAAAAADAWPTRLRVGLWWWLSVFLGVITLNELLPAVRTATEWRALLVVVAFLMGLGGAAGELWGRQTRGRWLKWTIAHAVVWTAAAGLSFVVGWILAQPIYLLLRGTLLGPLAAALSFGVGGLVGGLLWMLLRRATASGFRAIPSRSG